MAARLGCDRDGHVSVLDQPPRPGREIGPHLELDYGACGMRIRNDNGQATVITVVFLVVLLGMAALVLDIGSWYRADRSTQSTADAAALAGAQKLPQDTATARSLALQYANKNGGGVTSCDVTISSRSYSAHHATRAQFHRSANGVYKKLCGHNTVSVRSKASAREPDAERAVRRADRSQ